MGDKMERFFQEMEKYNKKMIDFLPIEEELRKLKEMGLGIDEIRKILGKKSFIIEYVPKVLYHGSPECLDVINARESTQSGTVVYATDNPIHALFFSIFRNSSQVRAHIEERIDDQGKYQVEFILDERYEGALEETLTDEQVTIHILDGADFHKPNGEQYISREWISEEGKSIRPIDRITVNPKELLRLLQEKGLLHISNYDKSKDLTTVVDMICLNYAYGLLTKRAIEEPEKFEAQYDEFIKKHFPDYFDLSKKLRSFARKVMSEEKNVDEKLRRIRIYGRELVNENQNNEKILK